MSALGVVFEHVSRKEDALPWYFILGLCQMGGFFWGLALWYVTMRIYSRALKAA